MPSHITFKTNYSINLYLLAKNIFININTNMITNNYNSINFGARFINNVKLQKYNDETNSYDNVKASFVEFDPKNDKDLKAVQKVSTDWHGQLIAKNISALGFIGCFGLHHCSTYNAFNLADDLIEPFRGIIDYNVRKIYSKWIFASVAGFISNRPI